MSERKPISDLEPLIEPDARFARTVIEMEREIARIPMRINDDHLYGKWQAALILDVSHRTLEAWRAKGIGPEVTSLPNGTKKYRGRHLRAFMDDCAEERT